MNIQSDLDVGVRLDMFEKTEVVWSVLIFNVDLIK